MQKEAGRQRVIIEGVIRAIDGGRYPIKCTIGESIQVEADIFTDGHDVIAAAQLYRPEQEAHWQELPLTPLANEPWRGTFTVTQLSRCQYTLQAWVDHFATWRQELEKKAAAGQEVPIDLQIGSAALPLACLLARARPHCGCRNGAKPSNPLPTARRCVVLSWRVWRTATANASSPPAMTKSSALLLIAKRRASAPGTKCFHALAPPFQGNMGRSKIVQPACRTLPRWASMWSI
jgi:hypothetical protein